MIPESIKLQYSLDFTLYSWPLFFISERIASGDSPALVKITLNGARHDSNKIVRPSLCSKFWVWAIVGVNDSAILQSATPPPTIIPSSTAALVAPIASSIRSIFSRISISEWAPTLIIATPPSILARRSLRIRVADSFVLFSIWALISEIRSLIESWLPSPPIIVVESAVTITLVADPNTSEAMVSANE